MDAEQQPKQHGTSIKHAAPDDEIDPPAGHVHPGFSDDVWTIDVDGEHIHAEARPTRWH